MQNYGPIAAGIYFAIFGSVLASFALAIRMGVEVDGSTAEAGLWISAWVATKLTQPARLLATVALTPLVARGLQLLGWWRPPHSPSASEPAADGR